MPSPALRQYPVDMRLPTEAAHLKCKTDMIATCAFRCYMTPNGTLIASYNWHVAEQFHYRMKIRVRLEDEFRSGVKAN